MPDRPRPRERTIPRRRALTAIAGATGAWALGMAPVERQPPVWRWNGSALGARASLALSDGDRGRARRAIDHCLAEVARLERVFSLHRADSEIARLNRDGALESPSHDLVALLSDARRLSVLSGGAFDVTVQPLWRVYAAHFARADADPAGPDARAVARAAALADASRIDIGAGRIRLTRPGMALTMNGIAQGAITDRITYVLRDMGYDSVMVGLGEIRTAGGRPWRIGLDSGAPVDVRDGAVATSAPRGFRFDADGRFHHLLNPDTGAPAQSCRAVSVFARSAALADSLSTAIAVVGPCRARDLLEAFGGDSVRLVGNDGRIDWIG